MRLTAVETILARRDSEEMEVLFLLMCFLLKTKEGDGRACRGCLQSRRALPLQKGRMLRRVHQKKRKAPDAPGQECARLLLSFHSLLETPRRRLKSVTEFHRSRRIPDGATMLRQEELHEGRGKPRQASDLRKRRHSWQKKKAPHCLCLPFSTSSCCALEVEIRHLR